MKIIRLSNEDFMQSFSRYEPEYCYNAETDSLEIVGQIDIVEKIQSYKETSLNYLLDKYLDNEFNLKPIDYSVDDDSVVDLEENNDYLDDYTESLEILESLGFEDFNDFNNHILNNKIQKEVEINEKENEKNEEL